LAAAQQGSLVVVSGQTLYSFDLTAASGLQQPQGQCQLLQQASSLDLLQVSCSCPAEPGSEVSGGGALSAIHATAGGAEQLLVAAGLWVENRVVLLSWPRLEEVGAVDLEGQQPRSSSLLRVAGRPVLVVGTATGQVRAGQQQGGRRMVRCSARAILHGRMSWCSLALHCCILPLGLPFQYGACRNCKQRASRLPPYLRVTKQLLCHLHLCHILHTSFTIPPGAASSNIDTKPTPAHHFLAPGSCCWQVLLWELLPHKEPRATSSSSSSLPWRWSVRHGRCVQVTHSSISLQRLCVPLHATSGSSSSSSAKGLQQPLVECVWAQGAAGALLTPDSEAELLLTSLSTPTDTHPKSSSSSSSSMHRGPAVTDLVRVSRVCGSDGVVSLVGVHTASMPHSLAYVAANTRLCFGGLDPDHRLRWVAAPVRDTVEALVVHEPTGCVVALTAASDGGQHLRVLEATSLRQLLSLR
jgi:hypothetical protein